MAKAKKKETLTPEERLQAALVQESEQPYKVPENWCWVTLDSATSIIMGQSPSGSDTTDDSKYTPLIGGAADMGDVYPNATRFTKMPTKMSTNQDLILCIRATLGKPVYSDKEYCLGRGVAAIRPHIGNRSFYKYFFNTFEQYLYDNATGTTFAQVSSQILHQMPLLLPPLPEQQRIVDRIESLFAKLDEAKQKAQDVLDSFETRKAAILHKAFTGELTARWRKEHDVGMESWNRKPLSSVTKNHDSERIPLSQAERSKLARVYDYYGASGVIDKVDRFLFEGKKLLIGEDGANLVTRSKPISFIAEGQYWVNNHAHVLSATSEILLDFLCHYINSIDLTPYVTGSAQPKMTQAKMNSIPIPVPTIGEQTEIVRILDDLLAKEQQAKEAAEAVLEQIDLIKKSILARAFRGELGTNDPAEESAVGLVKEIIL